MTRKSIVDHIDQLGSIRDEWDEIRRRNACTNPLLSFDYLRLWYQCFAAADQVRIYRITDGAQVIGFLPLMLESQRQLRRLKALTTIHSPHSEPLVLKDHEEPFARSALLQLLADRGSWDTLVHSFSYSFSALPGLFSDELLSHTGTPWRRWRQPTYLIQLDHSFADYLRLCLSAKERKNVKQYRGRLKRAGDPKALAFHGREAQKMWPSFLELERSSWKGASRSAIDHLEHRWKEYYEGLLEILVEHNALMLHFLQLNGTVIAGAFGYRIGDIYHGLKIAHDETFRRLSPGNLIILQLVEDLLTRHEEIHYCHMFPEDHGFKHRYANSEATCFTTLIYGSTMRGRMMYRLFQAWKVLRHLPGISGAADFVRQRRRR